MLAVLAVSSVVVKAIQTIWPLNVHPGQQPSLSKLVAGRGVSTCKSPLMLLWTSCCYQGNMPVTINHFVPLYERQLPPSVNPVIVDDTPRAETAPVHLVTVGAVHGASMSVKSVSVSNADNDLNDDHDDDSNDDAADDNSDDNNDDDVNEDCVKTTREVANAHLSCGGFLNVQDVHNVLVNRSTVHARVPLGPKSNVAFVVDNSYNVTRASNKQRNAFADDCGAWVAGRTVKSYFWRANYKQLEYAAGQYAERKVVDKRLVNVPLTPQPAHEDVLQLCRYYSRLKRDDSYQRRVTYTPDDLSVALYEYAGTFPETVQQHGNAKRCKRAYVRTHVAVLDNIKQQCSETRMKPRDIYEHMSLNTTQDDQMPRDLTQVQRVSIAANGEKALMKPVGSKNLADDVQTLISSVHEHAFVREVHVCSSDSPRILLYTDEQIADIRRFCTANASTSVRSVLGIDRTFNLSSFYVTVTVFKNRAVVRCKTQESPIFVGPMMLHCNGKFRTYHAFFSHLYGLLADGLVGTEVGLTDLMTGTDDEKALEKALNAAFPMSSHMYCLLHVRKNVCDRLTTLGVSLDKRRRLSALLFSAEGLASAADSKAYVEAEATLLRYVRQENIGPEVEDYFVKIILPKLRNNCKMQWDGKYNGDRLWTNNNCESINNLLKMKLDWKPARLIDLVNHLHDVVRLQYADMERAMLDNGNFQLVSPFTRHKISAAKWHHTSTARRQMLFDTMMGDTGCRHATKTVTSTDGTLTVNANPRVARKPNQRKRARAERTG